MDPISRVLFYVFIVASMLGIGLQVNWRDIGLALRRKSEFVWLLLANFVAIPILGLIFVRIFPMAREVAIAFVLLACAPGGISALQFTTKHKDELALAGGTAFSLTFLSILISPLLMTLFLPQDLPIAVPYARAALFVVVFLLLPLVVGIFIHQNAARLAGILAKPISLLGVLAFVAVVVLTMALKREAKSYITGGTTLFILLFIICSIVIGWIMGGPNRESRGVIATASSMRNIALCIAIATRSFPEMNVVFPLIAFAAYMIPANLIFTILSKVARKKK
jgi:BASS family bile acid:Na+ symporter